LFVTSQLKAYCAASRETAFFSSATKSRLVGQVAQKWGAAPPFFLICGAVRASAPQARPAQGQGQTPH
jgi:hypothetical protein